MERTITYRSDYRPDVDDVIALYAKAGLNRPIQDRDRIQRMYDGANLIWTAWDGDRLVGAMRGWTDGGYDGYVCDLAVHGDYQKQGIGRELLRHTCEPFPDVKWILQASVIATHYYEHIGWQKIENGWQILRRDWQKPQTSADTTPP